jgi:hypothetical protein
MLTKIIEVWIYIQQWIKDKWKWSMQIIMYQGHEGPQEQKLKERFDFQTKNKTRLCDSKIRTQKLRTWTQDV